MKKVYYTTLCIQLLIKRPDVNTSIKQTLVAIDLFLAVYVIYVCIYNTHTVHDPVTLDVLSLISVIFFLCT